MMHDGVLVAIRNSSQLLVPLPQGAKTFADARAFQRNSVLLAKCFGGRHTLAVQAEGFSEFGFVQHRHFLLTPPAPEDLHDDSILAGRQILLKGPEKERDRKKVYGTA